jgi:hypothetical protein
VSDMKVLYYCFVRFDIFQVYVWILVGLVAVLFFLNVTFMESAGKAMDSFVGCRIK